MFKSYSSSTVVTSVTQDLWRKCLLEFSPFSPVCLFLQSDTILHFILSCCSLMIFFFFFFFFPFIFQLPFLLLCPFVVSFLLSLINLETTFFPFFFFLFSFFSFPHCVLYSRVSKGAKHNYQLCSFPHLKTEVRVKT